LVDTLQGFLFLQSFLYNYRIFKNQNKMFKKEVKIGNKTYHIGMPNTGQILEIETMKSIYSLSNYNGLLDMKTKQSYFALDLIDAMSYFSVLSSELRVILSAENWKSLDLKFALQLSSAFREWNKWFDAEMGEIKKEVENANKELEDLRKEEKEFAENNKGVDINQG
jgi:hypothetical protein